MDEERERHGLNQNPVCIGVHDFVASDQGGYEVLDLLFSLEKDVKVVMRDEVMSDDKGRDTHYTVYEAQAEDEDGNVYSYKIKPARNSDKTYGKDFYEKQTKQSEKIREQKTLLSLVSWL